MTHFRASHACLIFVLFSADVGLVCRFLVLSRLCPLTSFANLSWDHPATIICRLVELLTVLFCPEILLVPEA